MIMGRLRVDESHGAGLGSNSRLVFMCIKESSNGVLQFGFGRAVIFFDFLLVDYVTLLLLSES